MEADLLRPALQRPRHRRLDISRITDWRNWRDAVFPALEEMGFNLKKLAFS